MLERRPIPSSFFAERVKGIDLAASVRIHKELRVNDALDDQDYINWEHWYGRPSSSPVALIRNTLGHHICQSHSDTSYVITCLCTSMRRYGRSVVLISSAVCLHTWAFRELIIYKTLHSCK